MHCMKDSNVCRRSMCTLALYRICCSMWDNTNDRWLQVCERESVCVCSVCEKQRDTQQRERERERERETERARYIQMKYEREEWSLNKQIIHD